MKHAHGKVEFKKRMKENRFFLQIISGGMTKIQSNKNYKCLKDK